MRGTDISGDDMRHAKTFLKEISGGVEWEADQKQLTITREHFIRLVAWYGAIRANGDRSGKLCLDGKPLELSS